MQPWRYGGAIPRKRGPRPPSIHKSDRTSSCSTISCVAFFARRRSSRPRGSPRPKTPFAAVGRNGRQATAAKCVNSRDVGSCVVLVRTDQWARDRGARCIAIRAVCFISRGARFEGEFRKWRASATMDWRGTEPTSMPTPASMEGLSEGSTAYSRMVTSQKRTAPI